MSGVLNLEQDLSRSPGLFQPRELRIGGAPFRIDLVRLGKGHERPERPRHSKQISVQTRSRLGHGEAFEILLWLPVNVRVRK